MAEEHDGGGADESGVDGGVEAFRWSPFSQIFDKNLLAKIDS